MPKAIPRFQILKRDDFRCVYCGKRATDVELHIDHVIPRSRGGTNDTWNLVACCIPCNMSKGTDLPTDEIMSDIRERDARWLYPPRNLEHYQCKYCGIPMPRYELESDESYSDECERCNAVICDVFEQGVRHGMAHRG